MTGRLRLWVLSIWAWITAVEPVQSPVRGASRDRSLHGKARVKARRAA